MKLKYKISDYIIINFYFILLFFLPFISCYLLFQEKYINSIISVILFFIYVHIIFGDE